MRHEVCMHARAFTVLPYFIRLPLGRHKHTLERHFPRGAKFKFPYNIVKREN